MSIAKKPTSIKQNKNRQDEDKISKLISKGGSVATEETPQATNDDPKTVQLRIKPSWINKIDTALKTRPVKTARHTWFLEAIHEKLEREGASK